MDTDHRKTQIVIGATILMAITVAICGALIGWGYLPDILAEWIGLMIGIATSPFFMELSCVVMGLMLVVIINHWRRLRDGDEFVTLPSADQTPDPIPNMHPPSEISPPADRKVLNVESFLRLSFNDVPGLGQLANEYVQEIREMQPAWKKLAAAGDFVGLRAQLHRSRGSAVHFGFERLTDLLGLSESPNALEENGFPQEQFAAEIAAVDEALAMLLETFAP